MQKNVKTSFPSRGVRFDVYAEDEDRELSAFFEYMTTGNAESEFSKEVENNVYKAKTDDTLRSGIMTLETEMRLMERNARAEGIQEGIKEGEARGIEKTKLENAQKMKTRGFSISDIIDITGLSAEQIQAL